jgi:hypothetical protein
VTDFQGFARTDAGLPAACLPAACWSPPHASTWDCHGKHCLRYQPYPSDMHNFSAKSVIFLLVVLCAAGVPLRKLQAHGNDQNGGGVGHTELRSEKMSDAALATQQAILKTFDKGG